MRVDWNTRRALAQAEVEATLAALPRPLQERARQVPVIFERVPGEDLVADGIDPDTLGLFSGPEFAEEPDATIAPQITLFLENLWSFAERHEDIFRDEVRTTLLHELGHYLGLDENGLIERGLE